MSDSLTFRQGYTQGHVDAYRSIRDLWNLPILFMCGGLTFSVALLWLVFSWAGWLLLVPGYLGFVWWAIYDTLKDKERVWNGID